LWNNIAWADFMLADPNLLDEADRFSLQSLQATPWAPYAKGTRGAVLMELGRLDESIPLLRQALDGNDGHRHKSLNCCCLALAMARLGDPKAARAFIEKAAKFDPACPLLNRARSEVQQLV